MLGLKFAAANDDDAGGFLFSYENLLGVAPESTNDVNTSWSVRMIPFLERDDFCMSPAAPPRKAWQSWSTQLRQVAKVSTIKIGWLKADEIVAL